MSEWYSIEVFDGASSAALWADLHGDTLLESALLSGAKDWSWHGHSWGVVLELAFADVKAWEAWRALAHVQAALDGVGAVVEGLEAAEPRGPAGPCPWLAAVPRPCPCPGSGTTRASPSSPHGRGACWLPWVDRAWAMAPGCCRAPNASPAPAPPPAPPTAEVGRDRAAVPSTSRATRNQVPEVQMLMSTKSGAWSEGSFPFRALRSTSDHVTLSAKGRLTNARSIRMPRCSWKSPAR